MKTRCGVGRGDRGRLRQVHDGGGGCAGGSGPSVLYRRWPNRAAPVHAAMRHHMGSLDDHVPDTGDLRSDVLALLRQVRDKFLQVGP